MPVQDGAGWAGQSGTGLEPLNVLEMGESGRSVGRVGFESRRGYSLGPGIDFGGDG
jgi:hypothetical protein